MAAVAAAAAAALTLFPSVHHHHHHHRSSALLRPSSSPSPPTNHPLLSSSLLILRHHQTLPLSPPFAAPDSSSSSSSSSPQSFPYPEPPPLRSGRFTTPDELNMLRLLSTFTYTCNLSSGHRLTIRPMLDNEIDITAELLADSFSESMAMVMPRGYGRGLLGYLVKDYLVERRTVLPYAVTLLGFYEEGEGDEEREGEGGEVVVVVGTVEVSFSGRGANVAPPTPTPPKDKPYICNMTVKASLRRKGIGWHLLKASEELISLMSSSREIYLHCRIIDSAPFSMYTKAGYEVVKTDSLFVLLTLQRRKHLMYKRLPDLPSEVSIIDLAEETPS